MNCEDLDFTLDANAPETLTLAEKEAVDRHFASCRECRIAWSAYRELTAAGIPETPRDLRLRIAAALSACSPTRRPAMPGSLVIGGVLIVAAAAAAATLGLQLAHRAPVSAERAEGAIPAVAPIISNESELTPLSAAPIGDITGEAVDVRARTATSAAEPAALAFDPYSIVVVLASNPEADAQAAAWLAQCHEQVVQRLSATGGLNVISGERLSSYVGSDLPPEEIARQLGAGSVLVVGPMDRATLNQVAATRAALGVDPRAASCRAQQLDAETGAERLLVPWVDPEWRADGPLAFAENVAEQVRDGLLADRATLIAEAQAIVLDRALGDRERVAALRDLRQGPEFVEPHSPADSDGSTFRSPIPLIGLEASLEPIPGAFNEAVVAAAAQIGLTSTDGRAREMAWQGLRAVRHPYAVEALLTSLSNDPSENVRRVAALALGYLVDQPGVRDALTRAATEDASAESPVPCCIPSVREAARRALRSDIELRDSAISVVLDETLPSEERIRPLYQSIDGRGFPMQLSDAAAYAVFDIGRSAKDAMTRSRAWDALKGFENADFTRTLLDDLAGDPDENVRASAAGALGSYIDRTDVVAALEQARTDSSMDVRRAARLALDSNGR